jgi:YidC/Oxa1 family membrane protein insertase
MFEPIARVLAFFYSLPVVGGSVGIAIILLTAAVMILLMPLTLKATRSTIKMQEMQPRLKELQKEHKDDKQTMNAELMALYQENGINPVGGCLPMVAQLPVFLVLFNVLRGLSRRVSEAPFFTIAEQARSQVGGAPVVGDTFDPRYLDIESDMYVDLSQQTEMTFGPFDLAQEARDVIQNDIVAGIPYVLLILFVVATSFYQQRQVSSRRTGSIGMNPQQEMILKVLPLASGIWSFLFPAGLVLYWATSNVFRIGQQSYITRAYYGRKAEREGDSSDTVELSDVGDDSGDDKSGQAGNGTATKGPKDAATKGPKDAATKGPKDAAEGGPKSTAKKKSGQNKGGGKKKGSPADQNDKTADEAERPAGKKPAANAAASNDDGPSDDVSATNGSGVNGSSSAEDREAAWAKRRQRAQTRSGSKDRTTNTSSRVTPKGTKPGGSKKKRKR